MTRPARSPTFLAAHPDQFPAPGPCAEGVGPADIEAHGCHLSLTGPLGGVFDPERPVTSVGYQASELAFRRAVLRRAISPIGFGTG
jgi:hypothetical protein